MTERIGCRKVFLTHAGTAALEMAALLAGIEPGDEIVMPSYSFVSTASAFVLRGGIPVFVDIRSDTTFSFHETKNIISGEGGALLINDDRFIDRAEILWEKDTDRSRYFRGEAGKYTWVDIGSSFLRAI